jgi:hypothetical protein
MAGEKSPLACLGLTNVEVALENIESNFRNIS